MMRFILLTAVAMTFSVITSGHSTSSLHPRQAPPTLHSLAVAAGKRYFGAAWTQRTDPIETALVSYPAGEFGSLMPEAGMRWNETELNVDIWLWAPGDKFVTFSTINGQYLRCHALVSPHLPTWLTGPTFSWNKNSLTTILQRHIMTMMRRYRSFCKEWDVVSEALTDTGYRLNPFLQYIGPDYIKLAFQFAALADPTAKLYYSDSGLEFNSSAKARFARLMLANVTGAGIRVDGVGLYGRLRADFTQPTSDLVAGLRGFTTMGFEVAYSQIFLAMDRPTTAAKELSQSVGYAKLTDACMQVPECVGMSTGGVSDKYPSCFASIGNPMACPPEGLLFNAEGHKRLAYNTTRDTLIAYG